MIWQITYCDAHGNELKTGTFAAETALEALEVAASQPSLEAPQGTHDIKLRPVNLECEI